MLFIVSNLSSNLNSPIVMFIRRLRILLVFSKDVLVNGSSELFHRELAVSCRVEIIEHLHNFLLGHSHAFSLGEEFCEFLEIKMTVTILVSKVHPLHGDLLDRSHSQFLGGGLSIEYSHDLDFLLFQSFVCQKLLFSHLLFLRTLASIFYVNTLKLLDLSNNSFNCALLMS